MRELESAALEQAGQLARRQHPHPNPRVGAVLLDPFGRIVGQGAHVGPGSAHAEILALSEAGDRAREGTMVVTLEPCNHHGRTGPCTEALFKAGIKRVVVGAIDLDSRVAGTGVDRLRSFGIDVEVTEGGGEAIDPAYFHHRRTGRPLVTLKLAATLDGQIAPLDGHSRWITGDEARADAHRLRAASDAVMVGAGTVRRDDPRLDVRLPDEQFSPRPVVVAGEGVIPETAQIWSRNPIVIRSRTGDSLRGPILELAAQGYLAVLVEGGARLARSLWEQDLIDRVVLYLAGRLAGGTGQPMFEGPWSTLADSRPIEIEALTRLGSDLRLDLIPSGRSRP